MTKKEFLEALRQTPYKWRLTKDGELRAGRGKFMHDPITAVTRQITGEYYSSLDFCDCLRAAETIGLRYYTAWDIMRAADGTFSLRGHPILRRALLRATGVKERR